MFREAFKIFDRRRNGFITLKDLSLVTSMLGASLTQDELDEFMQEADMVGYGHLESGAFSNITFRMGMGK